MKSIHRITRLTLLSDLQVGRTTSDLFDPDTFLTGGVGQKLRLRQGKRKKSAFYLRLFNVGQDATGGNRNSALLLDGPRKTQSLRLKYFRMTDRGLANINGSVVTGRYAAPSHYPEYEEDYLVKTRKLRTATRRTRNKVLITASNPGSGRKDTIRAIALTK